MDLEKLIARARSILVLISLLGLMITAAGVVLTVEVASWQGNAPANFTIEGLSHAGAPMILVGVGLLITLLPWMVWPLATLVFRRAEDSRSRADQLMGTLESQRQLLESVRETTSLSDAAKQIAYRAKDLEILRQAIREDMEKQDFEAATILAGEMERRFGYGKEADHWKTQINSTSSAAIEARIRESVEHIDLLISKLDWATANRESERLLRQFPDYVESHRVRERVDIAKENQKRDLLKRWSDATTKDDLDTSVAVLKQLDQYLTPTEAEEYKQNARDVFRKKLLQLQAQFAVQVHDKNWAEALRIGKQITDEFPNTRMAAEVRERMPILQENARKPLVA
jgi:hypothetical protein